MGALTRVDQVMHDVVVVEGVSAGLRARLKAMRGQSSIFRPSRVTFAFTDERELAGVLAELRDLGLPMKGGADGWPPGEHFRELRDRGLVTGEFDELVWLAPDRPQITKR